MKKKEIVEIRKRCEVNPIHEDSLIAELLNFSEIEYKTDKKFDRKAKKYRRRLKELSKEHFIHLSAQFVAFELFRRGGLLKKCLRKMDLNYWPGEEIDFVKYSAKKPWRFSYCEVIDNPAEDIYIMRDCFSYEEFTLYSTGVAKLQEKEEHFIHTWFILIFHNGKCYQSYGPLTYFAGFLADDIYFFATEKNPAITSEKDLLADLNRDPIPYMMLVAAGRFPLIVSRGHVVQFFSATIDAPMPHFKLLQKEIDLDHKKGVYRIGLKKYHMPPHFSRAYYDSKTRELQLHALTEEGFYALVDIFKKQKLTSEILPDIIVSPAMVNTTEKILDKKVKIDQYEHLFKNKTRIPEEDSETEKINHYLSILTDKLNIKEEPNIAELAKEAGISLSQARDLFESIKNNGLASLDYYLEDEHEQELREDIFVDCMMEDLKKTNEPDIEAIARDAGIPFKVALELIESIKTVDSQMYQLPAVTESHEKEAKEEEAMDYFRIILAEEMKQTEEPDIKSLAKEAGIPESTAWELYDIIEDFDPESTEHLFEEETSEAEKEYLEKANYFIELLGEEFAKTNDPDLKRLAKMADIPLSLAMHLYRDSTNEAANKILEYIKERIKPLIGPHNPEKVDLFLQRLIEETQQPQEPNIQILAKEVGIPMNLVVKIIDKFNDIDPKEFQDFPED